MQCERSKENLSSDYGIVETKLYSVRLKNHLLFFYSLFIYGVVEQFLFYFMVIYFLINYINV